MPGYAEKISRRALALTGSVESIAKLIIGKSVEQKFGFDVVYYTSRYMLGCSKSKSYCFID